MARNHARGAICAARASGRLYDDPDQRKDADQAERGKHEIDQRIHKPVSRFRLPPPMALPRGAAFRALPVLFSVSHVFAPPSAMRPW